AAAHGVQPGDDIQAEAFIYAPKEAYVDIIEENFPYLESPPKKRKAPPKRGTKGKPLTEEDVPRPHPHSVNRFGRMTQEHIQIVRTRFPNVWERFGSSMKFRPLGPRR